ncbi:nucleotide-binding alpha-beta plait domain-containing protein, partial [Tanacetum coccineum]
MASSSNRRGAAQTTLSWTTAEEITLYTAWCNAMDTSLHPDNLQSPDNEGFIVCDLVFTFNSPLSGSTSIVVTRKKHSYRTAVGNHRSKEDDVNRISSSIFVTNFPQSFTAKDLFHVCKQYGHVVDSYIPVKRMKS